MTTLLSEKPVTTNHASEIWDEAQGACKRIAPLWPLEDFVAVNPFLGLSHIPFADACALLAKVSRHGMLMPSSYYRERWEKGEILDRDLLEAISRLPGTELDPEALQAWLASGDSETTPVLTTTEALDIAHGADWTRAVTNSIGAFCSAYFDESQALWSPLWKTLPLLAAWKTYGGADLEVSGASSFRESMRALPETPLEIIQDALNELPPPEGAVEDYLHRQLLTIRGWAGFVQYRVRSASTQGAHDNELMQLLAIRLACDISIWKAHGDRKAKALWESRVNPGSAAASHCAHGLVWQEAHECAWRRTLERSFAQRPTRKSPPAQSAGMLAQTVFCIDVRSEVFRRALEAASDRVQTLGFAGFFGLPIQHLPLGATKGSARCPVLLTPNLTVCESAPGATAEARAAAKRRFGLLQSASEVWGAFKTSAASCFSYVELLGFGAVGKIVANTFANGHSHPPAQKPVQWSDSLSTEDKTKLAAGALNNVSLTTNFARLVLFCGHGGASTNNPHAAGLDCGACGGHAGDVNAGLLASLCNTPEVRTGLAARGIMIPHDTYFVGGLHNTTTDDVTLFDLESAPESHRNDLAELQSALAAAGVSARRERAPQLGLDPSSANVDREIRRRGADWSQTRPEWALAGNAAFIAAPRHRTLGVELGGRAFLHDYDPKRDQDGAVLALILTAPVVVASWINLQYYGSMANNRLFGSGNKVLHNIVAGIGVFEGNGGDLQPGLPMQSLHDGKKWMHEPLRLHVVLEAPRERIDSVLERHASIRELVENRWVRLGALEDDGRRIAWRHGGWTGRP